jgi:dihydrofolate reductase
MLKIIAAIASGGVIGRQGKIPWNLPEDRRMFKEITMGGTLIVGRKTYEEIGGPLPGRDMIVVTSHGDEVMNDLKNHSHIKGTIRVAKDLKQAIRMAGDEETFLCGGERIYSEGLKYASVLYLTKVELNVEGDAFFPANYEESFVMIDRTRLSANCTLLTYVRK